MSRKFSLVPVLGTEWSDDQMRVVNDGMEATSDSVVPLDLQFDQWLVLDGERPIGLVSTAWVDYGVVEFGVRLWEQRMSSFRVLIDSLHDLFTAYEKVVARCYASNQKVRRLMQRAGFMLFNTYKQDGRDVHMYVLFRDVFMNLFPPEVTQVGNEGVDGR